MNNIDQINQNDPFYINEKIDVSNDQFNEESFELIGGVDDCNEEDWELIGLHKTAEGYEYDEFEMDKNNALLKTNIMNGIEDQLNSHTVMAGAAIPWDRERLINGKLSDLKKIGGKPLFLKSDSQNISASFFSVATFVEKISKMGGQIAKIHLHLDHPFFEIANPVKVTVTNGDNQIGSFDAARISYCKSLEGEFYNPSDFVDLCKKLRLEVLWEDTLEPMTLPTRWQWSSRQQNIIVMPQFQSAKLQKMKTTSQNQIEIEKKQKFKGMTSLLSPKIEPIDVIAFDNNAKKTKDLFNNLKLDKTSFCMIEMDKQLFFAQKKDVSNFSIFQIADDNGLPSNPLFRYELDIQEEERDLTTAGTVVLSMNQTNSFTQYTHEILNFLLEGVNVLTYDNAGKGLSSGTNSQEGLKRAVELCGEYLLSMGVSEEKIMFKGQCAGGLPSSEAAKTFKKSHVWIDQSPRNFSGLAGDIYAGIIAEKAKEESDGSLGSFGLSILNATSAILSPLISLSSRLLLPSFDIIDNLNKNNGMQIYSIGVPDEKGQGGDALIPVQHREEIKEFLSAKPNGRYFPMPAATHVTDWWLNPDTSEGVKKILSVTELSCPLFPSKRAQTDEEIIKERYQQLMQAPFERASASDMESSIYQLFTSTAAGDIENVQQELSHLTKMVTEASIYEISKGGLDVAKRKDNDKMTLFYVNEVKKTKKYAIK